MYWACISGRFGKGFGVFWEKSWGTITAETYSYYIVPKIAAYMQEHPGLQFQQDNASGHRAGYTLRVLASYGIVPVLWPPNSPDLSPIEDIWDWQKGIIDILDPDYHTNYRRLRSVVNRAWQLIQDVDIQDWIRETMRLRCQAVIDAQGGPTRF
jgi:transposase